MLLQLKELLALHGPTLCEFVQEPLRSVLKEEQMTALARFAQRKVMDFAQLGMTVLPGFKRMAVYPYPVGQCPAFSESSYQDHQQQPSRFQLEALEPSGCRAPWECSICFG
jgi:hypothetical protein